MEELSLRGIAFAAATTLLLAVLSRILERALPSARGGWNGARRIESAGNLLGVFAISAAVVAGCVEGVDWKIDALWTAVYGSAAVALLHVTGRLGVRALLRAELPAELESGNVAAGIAAGAHHASTGILLASCIYGTELATLGISVAFFVIAQATLHLFVMLFRAVTSYDDADEVRRSNVAAAISYSGITLALALIVGHAAEGEFVSWGASLRAYALALTFAAALYPVRQVVVQTICLGAGLSLRGGALDEGVGARRDVALGVLEASAYLGTAFLVNGIR